MPSEIEKLRAEIAELRREMSRFVSRHALYPLQRAGDHKYTEVIRFTILSANCSAGTAEVQIDARNCPSTESTGESDLGTYESLTVHDPTGCHLDEPDVDLEDREGYAIYMKSDYDGSCQWEITEICCDPDPC